MEECICVVIRQLTSLLFSGVFFLMVRRPPRSTQSRSSAASDVYKRQGVNRDPFGTGMGAKLIFNTNVFCFAPPDYKGTIPCLLYTSPSPRDRTRSRMPSSA